MDVKGTVLLQLFNKSKLRNGTKTFLELKVFSIFNQIQEIRVVVFSLVWLVARLRYHTSGVARGGGGNWGNALLGAGPGSVSTHFIQSFKNAFLSRNMPRNAFFWKSCKITAASGAAPFDTSLLLPSSYTEYSFGEPVSNVKRILFTSKNNRSNNSKLVFCFWYFHTFAPIFHFKILQFLLVGRKSIFAPEPGYPCYATVS